MALSLSRCSAAQPRTTTRAARSARRLLVVRAEAEAAPSPSSSPSPPPVLEWPVDKETARDVFAFTGPLAERLNGRMAMLGFAGIAVTELSSQLTAGEQLAGDWFGVLLLSVTFTIASLFPKFTSGTSLAELHAAATSENLKGEGVQQALQLFDQSVELLTGRVAMLGLTGLAILETAQGKPFF